jgi:predicted transcriptional regulator
MNKLEFHKAQVSILRTLRHAPAARYSTLMRPTGLVSDVFKFHLRKLIHLQYIHKLESGIYELTPSGKEFANNLSKVHRAVQKQPKLSVAIIVPKMFGTQKKYLFQQRRRSPFYGFWSCISGPVQWGEPFEATAKRELKKQTGLTAEFILRSFYRKSDYDSESKSLLEDKLFAVVEAVNVESELCNTWPGGLNGWMTVAELKTREKYFSSTCDFVDMITTKQHYKTQQTSYNKNDY